MHFNQIKFDIFQQLMVGAINIEYENIEFENGNIKIQSGELKVKLSVIKIDWT